MSELTDLPTLASDFSHKTGRPEKQYPDRVVPAEFDRALLSSWLKAHGFDASDVAKVVITGQPGGIFLLIADVFYRHPGPPYKGRQPGGKFFVRGEGGEDTDWVASERRIVPLLSFPGELISDDPPGYQDLVGWAARYGIGKNICQAIVSDWSARALLVTEWIVEDDGHGLQTTRIELPD